MSTLHMSSGNQVFYSISIFPCFLFVPVLSCFSLFVASFLTFFPILILIFLLGIFLLVNIQNMLCSFLILVCSMLYCLFIYIFVYLSMHLCTFNFFISPIFVLSLSLQYFNLISASVSLLTYAFMYFHVCALIVLIWTVMASEYM